MYLLHVIIILSCAICIYTGPGGYLTLINETDSDWELLGQESFNMVSWNFPYKIKSGSTYRIYVEWSRNRSKDYGIAIYQFNTTNYKIFAIEAVLFKISITFNNITIEDKPNDAVYDLGWVKNRGLTFILVEYQGRFISTGLNTADWMKNNIDMLGKRTLKRICLPGTHNSGMNTLIDGTSFSHPCNTLAQRHRIKGQLELGIRYFDIRPVLKNRIFMTGHYERICNSWQGGVGQSIESIVDEINQFTDSHSEVIVIGLSHSHNTDHKFQKFIQSEWEGLFNILFRIKRLFNGNGTAILPELTVNELTNNGKNATVIIEIKDTGVELGKRLGKGFYYPNNIQIYDSYTKTNKFPEMALDQVMKMAEHSKNFYFLLSWTLTQSIKEAVLCPIKRVSSIQGLAEICNSHLAYILYPLISHDFYPNIICIDDVKNTEIAALALAINKKIR